MDVFVVEVALSPGLGTRLPNGYNGGDVTHLFGCVIARMLPLKVSIFLPVAVAVRIQPQKCIKYLTNWIQLALRRNKYKQKQKIA